MKNVLLSVLFCSALLCAQFTSSVDYGEQVDNREGEYSDYLGGEMQLDLGNVEWDINYVDSTNAEGKNNYTAKTETTVGAFKLHYQKNISGMVAGVSAGYAAYVRESSFLAVDLGAEPDTLIESGSFDENLNELDLRFSLAENSGKYGGNLNISHLTYEDEEDYSSFFLSVNPFYHYRLKNNDELGIQVLYTFFGAETEDLARFVNSYYSFPAQFSMGVSYKLDFNLYYYKLSYKFFSFEDYIYADSDDNSNIDFEFYYNFAKIHVGVKANIGFNLGADFSSMEKPLPAYYYSFEVSNRFFNNRMEFLFRWDYAVTTLKIGDDYYLSGSREHFSEDLKQDFENDFISNKAAVTLRYFL